MSALFHFICAISSNSIREPGFFGQSTPGTDGETTLPWPAYRGGILHSSTRICGPLNKSMIKMALREAADAQHLLQSF